MKRLFALFFAILIAINTPLSIYAIENDAVASGKIAISNMTYEQKLKFMVSNGIEIPEGYEDFAVSYLLYAEANPNANAAYGSTILIKLATSILDLVNKYYPNNNKLSRMLSDSYVLQDSIPVGEWDSIYREYNCYAYVLDYTNDFYDPGSFSGSGPWHYSDSVSDSANKVKADLMSPLFSYDCVYVTSTRPINLSSDQSCICIRQGDIDFHFMKLEEENDIWFHKPSSNQPLQYLYSPPGARIWTNEYYDNEGAHPPSTTYYSDIYYIVYQSNHTNTREEMTGYDYYLGQVHYFQYALICLDCDVRISTSWRPEQ